MRPPCPEDAQLPGFELPEAAPRSEWTPLTRGGFERDVAVDPATGDLVGSMRSGFDAEGRVALGRCAPVGMDGGDGVTTRTRIHPGDPTRTEAAMAQRTELRRAGWSVAVETDVRIRCTKDALRVEARLVAEEGGRRSFERRWDERVPRQGI